MGNHADESGDPGMDSGLGELGRVIGLDRIALTGLFGPVARS
jgi:hypothetical protein